MAKRSYGSGGLFVYKDKTDRESWYDSWRAGTRRVQRKIGPKRSQGGTSGLTRVQAESASFASGSTTTSRSPHRRTPFLQPRELDELIDAVPDDSLGAVERPLYLAAALTGLRQGELLALKWMDVDWLAGRVRVADNFTRGKFDSPKSHEGRSVPMADRLARELELHSQRSAYRTDDDLVFCHPHTGNVLDPSKMRKRFRETITRAGVREITFHELRHTFGTQMAAAGAPLRAIQEWMGHADAKTTEIYRHYAPDPTNGAQLVERAFSTTPSSVPESSPTQEQAR
jgi:integrase